MVTKKPKKDVVPVFTTSLEHSSKELALAESTLISLPAEITNMGDYKLATDAAAMMSMRIKNATTACKYFTDPLTTQVKEIKGEFAKIIGPAEELLTAIKERMKLFYVKEQAYQDTLQKQIEAKALSEAGSGDLNVVVPVVNNIKTQQGDFGSSTARKIKKWRVVTESVVPRQYLMLDDVKITAAMRAGTMIAGIEYYEDVSMVTRTH